MRQSCPCVNRKALDCNAKKPIALCNPMFISPYDICGTECGGNANLKPVVICDEQICVESPFGTQCVKSLAEQVACPPFVPERQVAPARCRVLVNSLTCCNPRNPNLITKAVKDCCGKAKKGHPCPCKKTEVVVRKLKASDTKSKKSHKSHKSHKSAVAK